MKRILILVLFSPLFWQHQSFGSDIEARLKALEEIITKSAKDH